MGTLCLRGAIFCGLGQVGGSTVASGGRRIPRFRGVVTARRDGRIRWSAGVRQGCESLDRAGDHIRPGPSGGETEPAAAAGGDQLGGGGERPEAELLGSRRRALPVRARPTRPAVRFGRRRRPASTPLPSPGPIAERSQQNGGRSWPQVGHTHWSTAGYGRPEARRRTHGWGAPETGAPHLSS